MGMREPEMAPESALFPGGHGLALTCRSCGGAMSRSRRRNSERWLSTLLPILPFRCIRCERREKRWLPWRAHLPAYAARVGVAIIPPVLLVLVVAVAWRTPTSDLAPILAQAPSPAESLSPSPAEASSATPPPEPATRSPVVSTTGPVEEAAAPKVNAPNPVPNRVSEVYIKRYGETMRVHVRAERPISEHLVQPDAAGGRYLVRLPGRYVLADSIRAKRTFTRTNLLRIRNVADSSALVLELELRQPRPGSGVTAEVVDDGLMLEIPPA